MEGSTVSLYTNTAAVSILHTSNEGYTKVVTDRSSDYRLFDTKLIIVSLSASTQAYQNNITVFKGKDVRISTESYNQVVVWYKITAGLLVPVVDTSIRIQVRPSVLLIRKAVTTDQGTRVYMGKSGSGDWFMFTVTVIDKVDPISYWVMHGDTFAISLRKQYSDIKWYFMSSTYLLISNSATYSVLNNGQGLVIKNMRENQAGYYQVTYVSGRSPSNVFYELKIGKVIRRTQIHALDGEEIRVSGSSRNPTGWCFKGRSEEPTTPLRMGDVEVVGTGLIISKLTVQNTGTYIYAFGNGDMEVFDIVRVVLPSLLNTMNFWLGQQIELRVRSNQIVSTWYKVSGGVLTPVTSSVQIDTQSLLIPRAELTHQGLYLALTDSNQWLAWRVNVNQEPPNYTTIVAPEGVNVRLDVTGLVLNWYIFPSTSPLRTDSRVQVGSKHLVLRNFDSSFQGFQKMTFYVFINGD
ncbi:uncharacterized protein LOC134820153 [Bolinopsis microptera]|uniref:uncharacterized protein LOC134820153 n=1 Tax=Bolinopsis microptera TaxID=2820187 RepID=UPI003078B93B